MFKEHLIDFETTMWFLFFHPLYFYQRKFWKIAQKHDTPAYWGNTRNVFTSENIGEFPDIIQPFYDHDFAAVKISEISPIFLTSIEEKISRSTRKISGETMKYADFCKIGVKTHNFQKQLFFICFLLRCTCLLLLCSDFLLYNCEFPQAPHLKSADHPIRIPSSADLSNVWELPKPPLPKQLLPLLSFSTIFKDVGISCHNWSNNEKLQQLKHKSDAEQVNFFFVSGEEISGNKIQIWCTYRNKKNTMDIIRTC